LVAEGGVYVDGLQELRKTFKVRAGQVVRWGDHEISVQAHVTGQEPFNP
jgi:ribosome-associated protein